MPSKLNYKNFVTKANIIYNNKYDYSLTEYVNSKIKVKIICPNHGLFEQIPNTHLLGCGCLLCGFEKTKKARRSSVEKFIEKSNLIHKNKYSYSVTDYINARVKVKINCFKHGIFNQLPPHHLNGHGCPKCAIEDIKSYMLDNPSGWNYHLWENAGLKSKNFDSFKVYIIECWNDTERFYKIGKTFKSVKARFKSKCEIPYNYKVLNEYIGTAREISILENELKNKHKEYSYIPKNEFNGMYECFNKIIFD